jgi:hypothetical protein
VNAEYFVLSLLASIALTSCVPTTYTIRPGAHGVLSDSRSHRPVADAEVTVISSPPEVTASGRSAADGSFHIPAQRETGLFIAGMDFAAVHGSLRIRHSGYRTLELPIDRAVASPFGPSVQDFGTISLRPASP